jgi:hypothetical protein
MSHPKSDFAIEMTSEIFGSELFRYATEEDRISGLIRLMKTVEKLADGVERDYHFGMIGADNEISGDIELAASWDGEGWVVAEYGIPSYSDLDNLTVNGDEKYTNSTGYVEQVLKSEHD